MASNSSIPEKKMIHTKTHPIALLLLLLSFSVCYSCAERKHPKEETKKERADKVSADGNAKPCDPKIWDHVYNPSRLKVLDKCMTVTGVIEESSADEDGDQHMLLKLDAGQENLLRKENKKRKDGNLVIEAVCMNKIKVSKVGKACKGYSNNVQLPNIGDHVKVTGSYVIDSHNGWSEIHPISTITVLK